MSQRILKSWERVITKMQHYACEDINIQSKPISINEHKVSYKIDIDKYRSIIRVKELELEILSHHYFIP